ncbi:MAG: PQQ-like beta-propeller repeat protein [Bacteroidales bacterium]|nr:PQQ-like beta-propeller repeat protein [Bacteroidales bacterium]
MKRLLFLLVLTFSLHEGLFSGLITYNESPNSHGNNASASTPQKSEEPFNITLVPKEIKFFKAGTLPVVIQDTVVTVPPEFKIINIVVDNSPMTAFLFVQRIGGKKSDDHVWLVAWDIRGNSVLWNREIDGKEGYIAGDLIILPNNPAMALDKKTGLVKWIRDESIILPIVSKNVAFSKSLSAVDLQDGRTRWIREITDVGGYFERVIVDSLMIMAVDGLHAFNLYTGKGWDLVLPTWEEDESNVLANKVLGAPFTAIGRNYMSPEKADVYSGMVSNILIIEEQLFYTAKDYVVCLDLLSGRKIWHTRLPEEKAGSVFLFRMGDNIGLINRGFCWLNNAPKKYLYPYFLAIDKRNGNFLGSKAIKSMNIITDYAVMDSAVFIFTGKEILKYSVLCRYFNSLSLDRDASLNKRLVDFKSLLLNTDGYYVIPGKTDSCFTLKSVLTKNMYPIITKNGIVVYDGLLQEKRWFPGSDLFSTQARICGHLLLRPMKESLSKRIIVDDSNELRIIGYFDLPGINILTDEVIMYVPDMNSVGFLNCSGFFRK